MKSKATRMGGNTNEVHQNIVHHESITKETKFLEKNRMDHYQLNPNNGNLHIYLKITKILILSYF